MSFEKRENSGCNSCRAESGHDTSCPIGRLESEVFRLQQQCFELEFELSLKQTVERYPRDLPICDGEWLLGPVDARIHSGNCMSLAVWYVHAGPHHYCGAHLPNQDESIVIRLPWAKLIDNDFPTPVIPPPDVSHDIEKNVHVIDTQDVDQMVDQMFQSFDTKT